MVSEQEIKAAFEYVVRNNDACEWPGCADREICDCWMATRAALEAAERVRMTLTLAPVILACVLLSLSAEAQERYRSIANDNGGLNEVDISKDYGGVIDWYERKYFSGNGPSTHWVIDGYCNSSCTMVTSEPFVCATNRAAIGFHSAYTNLIFWKVKFPKGSQQMYARYPKHVQEWVNRNHALDQITPLTFMVGSDAIRFPSSYGVVKGKVHDFVKPCDPDDEKKGPVTRAYHPGQ